MKPTEAADVSLRSYSCQSRSLPRRPSKSTTPQLNLTIEKKASAASLS
jgi:hypothetical protein